jgi:DNA-binding LacI/PurR family transcriptional regulator
MANKRTEYSVLRIAELAGVSSATVSRVLNYKENVARETRAKVMAVLDSLDYQPPSLHSGIPIDNKLLLMSIQTLHNPICSYAVDGVQAAAAQHGYQLLLVQTENVEKTIDGYESLLKTSQAAGLLLLDDLIDESMLERLARRVPFVQVMGAGTGERTSSVAIDDTAAAVKAVNYLLSIGRTRIALLNSSLVYRFATHREAGYRTALEGAGVPVDERLILHLPPDFRVDSAISAAEALLSAPERPDAFFAASDTYAAAILRACRRLGLAVPKDVAVVGFDNTSLCMITDPTITTMVQPAFQIGFLACHLLVEKIRSKNTLNKHIVLDSDLMVRGSTL